MSHDSCTGCWVPTLWQSTVRQMEAVKVGAQVTNSGYHHASWGKAMAYASLCGLLVPVEHCVTDMHRDGWRSPC